MQEVSNMKFISHRANLYGPEHDKENKPERILETIKLGFDVEIDLRVISGNFFLGHDDPQYEINKDFLLKNKSNLWIHAKNFEAAKILKSTSLNWFWHENDKFVLTSHGHIWAYPDIFFDGCIVNQPSENSEFWKESLYRKMKFYGICHDNIMSIKQEFLFTKNFFDA